MRSLKDGHKNEHESFQDPYVEDTDPALIPHDMDIGERSTFRSFNDVRRIKYFGRPISASPDANLNVLKYLFYQINLDQRLFGIPPNVFFLSTTGQVFTRIVKKMVSSPIKHRSPQARQRPTD